VTRRARRGRSGRPGTPERFEQSSRRSVCCNHAHAGVARAPSIAQKHSRGSGRVHSDGNQSEQQHVHVLAGPRHVGPGTSHHATDLALVAACVPAIAWLARKYTFAPPDRPRSATVHVVAGLVFAFVHNTTLTLIYVLLLAPDAPALDTFGGRFRTTLAYHFYQDALAYGALLATFLALHYADLRSQLAEARLTALRSQLNPHFFFNTRRSRHSDFGPAQNRTSGALSQSAWSNRQASAHPTC
jgi:hypothetical protein